MRPRSLLIHDGISPRQILASSLGLGEGVAKSARPGSRRALQPIDSSISEIKRSMHKHIGGRKECAQIHTDWMALKGLKRHEDEG